MEINLSNETIKRILTWLRLTKEHVLKSKSSKSKCQEDIDMFADMLEANL